MILPNAPIDNGWQTLGQGLQQGAGIVNNLGEQQNALQAMVERRTQAALEQKRLEREIAQRDWEFQQKQNDDAKTDKAREQIADLLKNGVPGKDIVNTIPAETRNLVSPSSDIPQEPPTSIGAIAAPQLGYQTPSAAVPQVTTPEQTVTTPGESRPATMADYQAAVLPVTSPDAFVKTLTPPNKAAAISAARAYILNAKAAGNSVIKGTDLDQAALAGDPTGSILLDKDYNNFKKAYATDAQAQNANSNTTKANAVATNATTNEGRLAEQKVRDDAAIKARIDGGLNPVKAESVQRFYNHINDKYAAATNSSRSGIALGSASNAYLTITKTLNDPTIPEMAVTGLKDQLSKLLNPGYAVTKTQFDHLTSGGLQDEISNWVNKLGHGYSQLTPTQVSQYKEYVNRIKDELKEADNRIYDKYNEEAVNTNKRLKLNGDQAISIAREHYSFQDPEKKAEDAPAKNLFGPVVTPVKSNGTPTESNSGNKKQKWGVDANGMPVPLEN